MFHVKPRFWGVVAKQQGPAGGSTGNRLEPNWSVSRETDILPFCTRRFHVKRRYLLFRTGKSMFHVKRTF